MCGLDPPLDLRVVACAETWVTRTFSCRFCFTVKSVSNMAETILSQTLQK